MLLHCSSIKQRIFNLKITYHRMYEKLSKIFLNIFRFDTYFVKKISICIHEVH